MRGGITNNRSHQGDNQYSIEARVWSDGLYTLPSVEPALSLWLKLLLSGLDPDFGR